jgi:predicted HicB family RNase H-like nuclease
MHCSRLAAETGRSLTFKWSTFRVEISLHPLSNWAARSNVSLNQVSSLSLQHHNGVKIGSQMGFSSIWR